MKKVLLSSVVALAVFSAAAPVFAQGENPNASNQLIQKKYVSWRDAADEANTQVAAHDAEIRAEVATQPSVVAAQATLNAAKDYTGHDHDVKLARAQEDFDRVYNEAYNTVRNRYIQVLQQKYVEAAKAQRNFYDETAVEANRTNEQRITDDQVAQGTAASATQAAADQAATKPEDGKPGAADQAKKADAAAKKAGAKEAKKALPKTHAAK